MEFEGCYGDPGFFDCIGSKIELGMALGKAQVAQHRGNIDYLVYFLLVALFQN